MSAGAWYAAVLARPPPWADSSGRDWNCGAKCGATSTAACASLAYRAGIRPSRSGKRHTMPRASKSTTIDPALDAAALLRRIGFFGLFVVLPVLAQVARR